MSNPTKIGEMWFCGICEMGHCKEYDAKECCSTGAFERGLQQGQKFERARLHSVLRELVGAVELLRSQRGDGCGTHQCSEKGEYVLPGLKCGWCEVHRKEQAARAELDK